MTFSFKNIQYFRFIFPHGSLQWIIGRKTILMLNNKNVSAQQMLTSMILRCCWMCYFAFPKRLWTPLCWIKYFILATDEVLKLVQPPQIPKVFPSLVLKHPSLLMSRVHLEAKCICYLVHFTQWIQRGDLFQIRKKALCFQWSLCKLWKK